MIETFKVLAMLLASDPAVEQPNGEFFLANNYYMMLHEHADRHIDYERWLRIRWKNFCRGEERYQAMGEAYDMGRPNPCSGAKEWKR